jgi:hypothetical protein
MEKNPLMMFYQFYFTREGFIPPVSQNYRRTFQNEYIEATGWWETEAYFRRHAPKNKDDEFFRFEQCWNPRT